jgi:hypothetical protein
MDAGAPCRPFAKTLAQLAKRERPTAKSALVRIDQAVIEEAQGGFGPRNLGARSP